MLATDSVYAIRVYARTPGASLIAVAVLAIAIAFVSAFLSLYVDLAVRPHPGFDGSGELVTIGQNDGAVFGDITPLLVQRIDEELASLEFTAGYLSMTQQLGPARETLTIELVTRQFFDGIRPRLALGRGFDERDHAPGAEPVAVISDAYWRSAFGRDPGVVGATVEVTGRVPSFFTTEADDRTTAFRIVGVMAPGLPGLLGDDTALWLPYESAAPLYLGRLDAIAGNRNLRGIGRLAPGAGADVVAAELNARFAESLETGILEGFRLDAVRGLVRDANVQRETESQLILFLGGSLLLACAGAANVSLFLLSRAPGRRRELGIRMAVGATTRRLARQLATEALLLVVVAAVLGLVLSVWLGGQLQTISFLEAASWRRVTPFDWRVLVLVVVFAAVLAALVALAPVLGLGRHGIGQSSRQVTSRANPTQRLASTVQLAIAGAVGAAALAFVWHLASLLSTDPGFSTEAILIVTPGTDVTPGGDGIGLNAELLALERERRREAILGIAGVDAVAFSSGVPGLEQRVLRVDFANPVQADELVQLDVISADRAYFGMLGLRFVAGGPWEDGSSGVLVFNAAAAEALWGRTDIAGEFLPGANAQAESNQVVGVLADFSLGHPAAAVRPQAYAPIFFYSAYEHILVATALPAAELRAGLDALVAEGRLEISIDDVRSLEAVRRALIGPDSARTGLAVTTAVVVLLVAAFGFYGTQQFLVSAGRREYAIRAALGAGPRALGHLVLRRGLELALPGLIAATWLAAIVASWLRGDFLAPNVAPLPVTAGVVAGLVALLLAAGFGPARIARRTAPASLLRQS